MSKTNLLELVMIIKNSGNIITECLNSVKDYIDYYTILDTGSTDNTVELVKETLNNKKGKIYQEPFIDFSTSRNRSLELASKKCKYIIILDDSYILNNGKHLRQFLEKTKENKGNNELLSIKIKDDYGNIYYSPRIISSTSNLKYIGRVHETLDYNINNKHDFIDENVAYIFDIKTPEHDIRSKNRCKKDIELLLLDEQDNPTNSRTLYYLAQIYTKILDFKNAINYYTKLENVEKIQNNTLSDYHFSAMYDKICLEFEELQTIDMKNFKQKLLEINKLYPNRAEPLYRLAVFMFEEAQQNTSIMLSTTKLYNILSLTLDKLITISLPLFTNTIVDTKIYTYRIPYMYIDVNLKTRNFQKAFSKLREMLNIFPYDQPLLNIKYSVCDNSMYQISKLSNDKTIVIHIGKFKHIWNPNEHDKTISGSEYMAINLAKEFEKHDYRVFVFGPFSNNNISYEGIYNNIEYVDIKHFPEFSLKYVIDHLIVSRFPENLVYYDNIKNVYLWVHDILPHLDKGAYVLQGHATKFKGAIVMNDWHKNYIMTKTGIPESRVIISRNAIYSERFNYNIEKIPYRFIYSSHPSRGLSYLINMIPKIKEKYPETELYIFANIEEIDEDTLEKINKLSYVFTKPRLTQEELSIELLRSDVWLYPTDFPETYCISALEAMAAGCLVASVKYAGLEYTIGDRGVLTNYPISNNENRELLLFKLFNVLDNIEIKNSYINKAKTWALQQTYENLALEWLEKIFTL